jgi:tRNA (mo5U34)-methyltransferase
VTLPSPLELSRHWTDVFAPLLDHLVREGQTDWAGLLERQLHRRFVTHPHGDMGRWQGAFNRLPPCNNGKVLADRPTVTVQGEPMGETADTEAGLRGLMPWRKGPFRILDVDIDTEWRSDWKWDRVAPYLSNLSGRTVLDVGCGSGYHCWRMWGAGARRVIGIDPSLLFLMQFLSVKRYDEAAPVDLLPLRMEDLPENLGYFDTAFSMGILYHRRSPVDHLLDLKAVLRSGGELVLETLVIEGALGQTLMPEDRYAMMRNVWFIPSSKTLELWLARAGFVDIRTVDETPTSIEEQRSTDWMRFQSLPDFLDPEDADKTVEGHPAPLRATVIARKP